MRSSTRGSQSFEILAWVAAAIARLGQVSLRWTMKLMPPGGGGGGGPVPKPIEGGLSWMTGSRSRRVVNSLG